MPRLIHLDGPPGIGKSTLARRWADDHPGTLCCDVDVLRTLVGGWRDDFVGVGAIIRPVAQAMIETHLRGGRDVVLPQLVGDPAEVERLEAVAERVGARFVECHLVDEVDGADAAAARFARRGGADPDPWHDHVKALIAADGGDAALVRWHVALEALRAQRPRAVVVRSREGDVDLTYARLVAALSDGPPGGSGGPPTMDP